MTFSHSSDATKNISTSLKILSHKVVQKSPPIKISKSTSNPYRKHSLSYEFLNLVAKYERIIARSYLYHIELIPCVSCPLFKISCVQVCQIAGKNCEMVYDTPQRCWDSQTGSRPLGGEGLFEKYYDACVGEWLAR